MKYIYMYQKTLKTHAGNNFSSSSRNCVCQLHSFIVDPMPLLIKMYMAVGKHVNIYPHQVQRGASGLSEPAACVHLNRPFGMPSSQACGYPPSQRANSSQLRLA